MLFITFISMQKGQDQSTTLLKKIEVQDELIAKLQAEQQKLSNYIKQFKDAIDKKINKEMQSSQKNVDEGKLEKQMDKELENAKVMLKNYQNELKNLQKKNIKNRFTSDNLLEMENGIREKQTQIKELNDDIKNLTIVKRKQEKLIEKKQKNQDGLKLAKVVQQIRKQKDILETLKAKHKQKQQILQKRKLAITQIEKQYIEKCRKYGEKPLSFEEFKQKRVQKRRQQSVNKVPNEPKKQIKKYLSIKDIINSHLEIENIEISEKSVIELRQKKIIAENSLKIARRKHEKEIEELEERVEILKKENQSLTTKFLQKRKEKQLIETSKTIDFKKNSSKTTRKLDPLK